MQNLWNLKVNGAARIQKISDTLDEKYRQRLADLGIIVGEEIQCMRKTPFGGPRVFQIQQTLFSFDREISESIFIEALNA